MNNIAKFFDLANFHAKTIGITAFILWLFILAMVIIFTHPEALDINAEIPDDPRPKCKSMPDGHKVCDR
ncbi:hypothetical protein MNBD_ALPHA03-1200 [hydrothermal vent metagenome]|uniref:Uncharacterized protein n=1 Tax=hydrothermal vent metagenome TaxID=652676 RepID=A0A3B1BPF5_9ZZZZ